MRTYPLDDQPSGTGPLDSSDDKRVQQDAEALAEALKNAAAAVGVPVAEVRRHYNRLVWDKPSVPGREKPYSKPRVGRQAFWNR